MLFFAVISVMVLALFAFVTAGGCGGSSNLASIDSTISDTPTKPDTPQSSDIPSSDPAVTGVFVGATATFGFDIDNDNKPDVLDFDGVQQLYAHTDGAKLSGAVPFMVWIDSLPEQTSPDIISTDLTAGVLYTFEVSKNFADPMGGTIPDITIYDPSGNAVAPVLTVYPSVRDIHHRNLRR